MCCRLAHGGEGSGVEAKGRALVVSMGPRSWKSERPKASQCSIEVPYLDTTYVFPPESFQRPRNMIKMLRCTVRFLELPKARPTNTYLAPTAP